MKKFIFCFAFVCAQFAIGQQDPLYSGEGFNVLQYNPASYGTMELYSVNAAWRLQWDGVQDAPKMLNVNTGGRVIIGPNTNPKDGVKFRLGTNYQYSVIGFQRNHDWKLAIGVPIRLGENSTLNIAIAPGLISMKYSPDWIPPQTPQDPLIPVASTGTAFDMNAGVMFNWKTLYAGFSSSHILAPDFNELNFSVARHYYLDAGYKIPVGKHFVFPMLQVKADGAGAIFQATTYFVFKDDLFTVGGGYRLGDAITVGAAFQKWGVRIAYHFDYMTNPLNSYGKGSHEVRLSYILPLRD